MVTKPITVAELPPFARQASANWTESERAGFIDYIARNPEAGDLIPGLGGIRKVHWGAGGSGKRSGARVIYFFHNATNPISLLAVCAKAAQEDLSPDGRKALLKLLKALMEHLQ